MRGGREREKETDEPGNVSYWACLFFSSISLTIFNYFDLGKPLKKVNQPGKTAR